MDAPATPDSPPPLGRGASAVLVAAIWVAAIGGALAAVRYRAFDLDRFFVPKELYLHAGALAVAVTLALRRGPRPWTAVDLALAAWLILSVVSAIAGISGWHAARALAITASSAMMFWGAAALAESGRSRVVVMGLVTAATLAGATSLAQAYGADSDFFSANRVPGGTLGNRNFIAHAAAVALPLALWLAATSRAWYGVGLGTLAAVILSAGLVLSRTRAAWLALALWGAAVLLVAWRSRAVLGSVLTAGRARTLVSAVVAGSALALFLPNTLDWRSASPYLDSVRGVVNYREGSGAGRLRQYANSLEMARANPVLGVGPGNWAAAYPGFAGRDDPSLSDATGMASNPWPSSDWVAAVAERGIPAAAALVALVSLLLVNALKGWRDSVFPSADRLAALAGGSAVFVGAVEGAFDAVTLLAFPSVLVWAAAGALVPAGSVRATFGIAHRVRRYAVGAVALAWSAMVAMAALKLDAMRLYSIGGIASVRAAAQRDPESYRIQLRAAEILADRGQCRLAYHNARAAAALFPEAAAPKRLLARCADAAP